MSFLGPGRGSQRLAVAEAWLCRESNPERTELLLSEGLEAQPQDQLFNLFYAKFLVERGEWDESTAYWQRLDLAEVVARRHLSAADQLAAAGQIEPAVKEYRLAASISPEGVGGEAFVLAGVLLMQQPGQLAQAQAMVRRALAAGNHEAWVYNTLAQICLADQDLACAEDALNHALARPNLEPATLHFLGFLRFKQGRLAEAVTLLTEAADSSPDNPWILWELGLAYEALGRRDEAERLWRKTLAIDPDFWHAQQSLEGNRNGPSQP
jgi:Flp pilus assembly protein TadD